MSRVITKRAMPLLLALILITSMVLFAPAYADVTNLVVTPDSGEYGDTIVVTGDGITAGKEVRLYWDLVQDWDGEAGLLNTTTAEASGEFEIWFDVPEAVAGTHYVWVEDVEANDFDKVTFTVIPLIDPSATSGLATDRITVDGYGFGGEKNVAILLVAEEDDEPIAGKTTSESLDDWDLTETTYSETLTNTPVEPGTVEITISGDKSGSISDEDHPGTLSGTIGGVEVEGTINYVTGEIELELAQALYATVSVSCSYNYYTDTKNQVYVFTTAVETNELGSFSRTIRVPDEEDMGTGDYLLYAFDSAGNEDYVDFTIGAMISLSVDEGPTGTVVEIRGRGFDPEQTIDAGEITINGVDCPFADPDVESVDIDSDGDFRVEIVIPMVDDTGEYTITVRETGAEPDDIATADFEVTGLPSITLTPEYGKPGDTVTIRGENFTQIEGTEVTLTITGQTWSETFELEDDGTFEGTFTIPALADGDYDFVATDDYGLKDSEEFRIGFMLVLVSPDEVETGELVTLMGRGFTGEGAWNATLEDGTVLVEDGDVDEDGDFTETVYMPTVPPGEYDVIFWDVDAEIKLTTTITVTATTTLTLDPDTAPAGYNVTVSGSGFVHKEKELIEWVLYNVTADGEVDEEWDLDVWVGAKGEEKEWRVNTTEDGVFEGWFEIPELDPGVYYINATQEDFDIYAQAVLTVIEEELYIEPTKTTFARGDVLSFTFESSFPDKYTLKIYDPDDNLYWMITIEEGDYIKIDTLHAIPSGFWTTYELPSDAPLGTWTWKALDEDNEVVANGTFTVVESALEQRFATIDESIQSLSEEISGVKEDVAGLKEDISGVKSDVADLKSDVAAAAKAAQEASKAVSELSEAVSEVAETATTAAAAAQEAKSAAEEAKTAASGLTPLIYGAIGVSLIAALAAIVSLIQISRRIAG